MKRGRSKGDHLALLLFTATLLLFNWPLLSIFAQLGGVRTFFYLFGVWILVIAGIGLYCRHLSESRPGRPGQEGSS